MRRYARTRSWIAAAGVVVSVGCHGLLDVNDPTLIRDQDIANASGANAQRLNASSSFAGNMGSIVHDVAVLTDEWTMNAPRTADASRVVDLLLDLRNSAGVENLASYNDRHWGMLDRIFQQTSIALPAVQQYSPDSLKGDFLAQLYGIRGYVLLQMAEDVCPGFPIDDIVKSQTVYGGPLTTDSTMAYANAQLDSALKYVKDSLRFVVLARVVKGRALLDQGKFSDAAQMVAPVPTEVTYSASRQYAVRMQRSFCRGCATNIAMGDREGINGEPYVSAHDPRIPFRKFGVSQVDSTDTLYVSDKGWGASDSLVFASGVEARLIGAEAALQANQNWKAPLDSLRASVGLDTLVDPGTASGRVDLLYRERAFWLYMTARRLGDMRRLISVYGRNADDVFPKGSYHGGSSSSTYSSATLLPFSFAVHSRYNPNITTGCTAR